MAYDIAAEVNDEIKKNLAAQEAADIQKEIENQRRTDFKSSMTVAAAFEPTKFAQALKVQRESGVPAKVAYDNADQIASLKQEAKFAGLFTAGPRTSEALSKPEHAIVAQGDEENLLRMEKAAEAADFYKQGFFERQIAQPLAKAIAQDSIADLPARMIQLDRISSDFDKIESGEASTSPWAVQYQQADAAGRKQMRDDLNLQRNLAIDKARVAQYDISQMPVDPTERKFAEAEGFAESASALASDPMFLGRVAGQAIPGTAEGLAASLINPLFGGAVEGINAGNYKFMEVLQEKGIDPADPIQLMQAIRDDDLMQEANTRAARYGAGVGIVGALSAGLLNRVLAPTKFNGRMLSNRTREGINVLAQVPAQGALEAAGELTGQIAERGQLSDVDAKEVALEGIVGGVMSLPEVGAFGTKRFTNHMIQARRAERAGKLQADLVEKSLQSSTRKNDPASFEAIVSTQLAGRPNEYLEIPAAKLQELNQSGQVNIAELLENVGIDPEHYTAQVELGGTITIKNSAYLAYLAEQDEFLRGSIRVAGNEYTLDDVQEIDKQMLAEMEKIASQFGQTDQVATAYSDVMGQLLNAGYERSAADTTARQYAAVMTRLAEQTGQTVEEVMAANPLNIGRDVPAPVQRIREDQLSLMLGRLRAGDIPQPGDMFGKSLTEYLTSAGGIQDIGGELAAFDADVGKRGRNRLTRTDGMTPDDAAMQAWERGYFPGVAREDVTPNLLIDALREEAAGTPRYSVEQENATLRDQAQSLEALQEYLDREGIDLATATDDEIRQRLGVQPGNQRLNQFAGRNSQTADLGNLKLAQDQIKAGRSPEAVRRATGWHRGADGKWRYEIADDEARFHSKLRNRIEGKETEGVFSIGEARDGNVYTLGEILDHPKLFAAYPHFRYIPVTFLENSDTRGTYYESSNEIVLKLTADPDQMLSTLLHEVQHAIQAREDFARGGNTNKAFTDSVRAALKRLTEGSKADVEHWQWLNKYTIEAAEEAADAARFALMYESAQRLIDYSQKDSPSGVMRHIRNEMQWLYDPMFRGMDEARELQRDFYNIPKPSNLQKRNAFLSDFAFRGAKVLLDRIPADLRQQFKKDTRTTKSMINSLRKEAEKRSKELVPMHELVDKAKRAERLQETKYFADPYDIYRSLAGEVEARNTQARQAMTDAERADRSPLSTQDVQPDEIIVMFGGLDVHAPIAMESAAPGEQTLNQADYMMDHRPPGPEDGAPLDDLTGGGNIYPDDVYSANGQRYYGTGHSSDAEAFRKAKSYRGEPDAPITIYRAVPTEAGGEINRGDWVAITKSYAEDHGEGLGDYKIITKQVKARDIFTNGDSIQEWGYWPSDATTLNQSANASPDLDRALAMSEDEYIATINPSGETNDEDGSARLVRGDLTDPQNATVLVTLDNGVTIERDEDGSFYAREGGDTIGEIVNYGDEVNVNVLPEARGKGVAVNLAAEFMRENPFFDAGSLTPGGEAVVRAAWRKLKAEQSTTLNQSLPRATPDQAAEYAAAVAGNKRRAAIKLLEKVAGVVEVDASFDRGGAHDAPGPGSGSPIYDVTRDGTYPDDFYSPNGLSWYGTGDSTDAAAYSIIKSLEASPNRPVKIYRAVPNDGTKKIIPGDWVTTVRQYAKDHGDAALGGDYKILSASVSARDLFTSGDSFAEYGYHPQPFKPEFPKSEAAKSRSLSDAAANFAAAHPESVGSADPNILNQGDEETPRGSITFGPRRDGVRRFDIKLTAKSDLSTVLHEMGHYYLEVIGDLVQGGKANEALSTDYAVIRDWLGAEEGKPLTVDQHEQFARGFEKYLAEGKAPSIELQTAFARFKRWLVGIYKDLKRLNVDLSPEIRSVFDRLLASQEAIDEAEQALALSQQFSENIQKIMTPEELANYARASQQARDDATDEIEREILKAERRKEQEWYREQRKAVEAEVRAELEAAPAYQARKYLFSNTPHPQTGRPVKLDTAAVTELFGTKSKQARFLGRARVKTGGMHPETAAFLLGYGNPVEMLTDMMSVEGLSAAIKTETDRRMAERYPDPRTSGELAEKALAAVGEREAEVQAIQLRALAREAGRKATQHRIIKEAARQHIARLRLRDVIPYQYQRASAKAARAVEEALLAGNLPKAYEEKERQLMNLHLYREAVKAQDLAEQKRAQAKAYMKAGAKRKRLQEASTENFELAYPDGRIEYAATKTAAKLADEEGATVTPLFNFLEQVDGLLQKYEFGIPRKAIRQQRESLQQFLAQMAGESIVVNPPDFVLLDRAERTNWKDLTIEQLVDVVDMIRQIDQMAKNKLFVLKGDKWAEYEPIRDAIAASIELNGHQAASGAFNRNFKDQIRKWGREWLGYLPADQIARELDGQDDLGPVQEHIVGPVQKAAREAVIREKLEMNSLAELVRQFYGDDDIKGMHDAGKLIAIPEIGDTMTRMQMVMLMANLGNEGNRAALLEGTYPNGKRPWTAETIQAVMARLDSNDADFVEALWAWVDKFWPEIAEAEAKRTGVAPPKVEGSPYPVKLADGKVRVLKGGYFPLKYDGEASIKTSQDDVGNAFKNMTAGRTAKAYTPDGHRIERNGSNNRPVKLDFSVLTGHVGNIVRDLTMTDPINQAWRFLHDTTVQGAFERANTKELHTALEIWMQDSAEGEKVDSGYMTASARWLRTGFTANVMLFNLANSMLNLAGTHPLVVLGKRWAMHGYRAAFMPANWEQMYELSSYMREARVESYSKDLALVQDQMAGKGGWRAAMTAAGFYLHNKTQQFMDAVVWMGAYEKGMSLDLVGQALIDYADQRVVEASGSGVFADRSALERGTLSRQTRQNEIVRGLTTLAGYMIRKMAIARRRTAETDFKDIAQAMTWAVDMALLFTIEGLAFAFVKGNVPDEDEDEQAKEWAKTAGWETFASVGSGLPPFGRPVVSAIQGFGGGSTSVDIFSEQFGNAIQQIKQGDADTTALKALVALTGTATKTPGIATNRVIDWLDRAQDGETPPWWELFTGNRNK